MYPIILNMSGQLKPYEFLTLRDLLLTLFPGSRDQQIWGQLSLNKKNFICANSSRLSFYCEINEYYNNSIVTVDGLTYQLSFQEFLPVTGGTTQSFYSKNTHTRTQYSNSAFYCFKLDPI